MLVTGKYEIYTLSGKQDELAMYTNQTVGDLKRKLWEVQKTFQPCQMRFVQNGKVLDNQVILDSVGPRMHLVYRLKPARDSTTIDAMGKITAQRWTKEVQQQSSPSKFISLVLDLSKVKA